MAEQKLNVTLKRSLIGVAKQHIKTVEALGLRKRAQTVTKDDTPEIRGMVEKVGHLVEVEELES